MHTKGDVERIFKGIIIVVSKTFFFFLNDPECSVFHKEARGICQKRLFCPLCNCNILKNFVIRRVYKAVLFKKNWREPSALNEKLRFPAVREQKLGTRDQWVLLEHSIGVVQRFCVTYDGKPHTESCPLVMSEIAQSCWPTRCNNMTVV